MTRTARATSRRQNWAHTYKTWLIHPNRREYEEWGKVAHGAESGKTERENGGNRNVATSCYERIGRMGRVWPYRGENGKQKAGNKTRETKRGKQKKARENGRMRSVLPAEPPQALLPRRLPSPHRYSRQRCQRHHHSACQRPLQPLRRAGSHGPRWAGARVEVGWCAVGGFVERWDV